MPPPSGSSRDKGAFAVETVWKSRPRCEATWNTALLLDGHIYGFDRGTLKSLDAATGEVKWKTQGLSTRLPDRGGRAADRPGRGREPWPSSTPIRTSSCRRAAPRSSSGKNWTAPTLAGGKLYLRNHEELVCLEMKEPRSSSAQQTQLSTNWQTYYDS